MRKVIVNTTPIIALADIGYLDILQKIYTEVIIPEAVYAEILSEPARSQVSAAKWIKVQKVTNEKAKSLFSARLHAGEVEVIMLAQESGADLLILDDNAAKKTAKYLGLTVTGTLGVILRAKRDGIIDVVKPLIDSLVKDGLYVSNEVQNYVLTEAGEKQA